MKRQRVLLWTGPKKETSAECQRLADTLPDLPEPHPLRRSALIEYYWGSVKFEIVASACSLRQTAWGSEQVTWLHCKAIPTAEIKPEEETALLNVLIPAHYVTAIQPGQTFRPGRRKKSANGDIGVFPPNQPTPEDALPLEEIESVVAELLTPERN
jgi:hypothetical protein